MKKQFLLLLLFSCMINAQQVLKQNKHWHFGYKAHFDFGNLYTDTPNQDGDKYRIPPGVFWGVDNWIISEGAHSYATVSDLDYGNFLFSSDGSRLYKIDNYTDPVSNTTSHKTMPFYLFNQDSGNSVILPKPKNSKFYYVISNTAVGLDYFQVIANSQSDVNVDANFTRVKLIDHLNLPINYDTRSRKITTVRHQNGIDYWLVVQVRINSDDAATYKDYVYTYLVTCDGVKNQAGEANKPFTVSALPQSERIGGYTPLSIKVSHANVYSNNSIPQIIKLAATYSVQSVQANKNIEGALVWNFNRNTGEVIFNSTINLLPLFPTANVTSLEFSPNSDVLYLSDFQRIFQVNLQNNAITPQPITLTSANLMTQYVYPLSETGPTNVQSSIGDLQIGPNNKIYVSIMGRKKWGEISNPNAIGGAQYVEINTLLLPSFTNTTGPNSTSIVNTKNAYTQSHLPQLVQQQTSLAPVSIVANNDVFGTVTTSCVPETTGSVLANDTVNGVLISSPLSGYVINQIGTTNNNIILNPDGTVTIYSGLAVGTYTISYQICETGFCPVCSNVGTISIQVSQGLPTGRVDDSKNSNQTSLDSTLMSVYPNPSSSVFNIQLNNLSFKENNYKLAVYNTLGQLVLEKVMSQNNVQIDLSNFENGTYFLKVQMGENAISKMIVKK